ncbi:unnamed protein product [Boreogadus saida]
MNEELSSINWEELYQLCENDTEGSLFLELFRMTVLQVTLHHAPSKVRPPGTRRSKSTREKYTLKRRRRKLNAQISTLRQENPTSQRLPKLIEEVNLLAFDISEAIISDLDAREAKAVGTVKSNPRYFYSYAKRFSKTKSTVAPLRSADGAITNDPQQKAELLQDQYVKVFSNPDAVNITECLANVQPELEEDVELDDFEFTEEDLISALKELDPYSATPDGCKEYTTTEGHVIEPAKSVRDLGVLLSSDRSWSPHIEQTVQSGRKMASWSINTVTSLEAFKVALGEYLRRIPDTPPVPGYTAVNRNSLLDWSNEKGGRT